jgi:hypothetical protein
MADDVEVKLGADVGDLKSNTEDGATSVDASLKKIQASLDGLSAHSQKTSDDVKAHTERMSSAFAALHENVRLRFGSINSLVEQFSTKLAAVGAALAGGALFSAMVSHLIEFNSEVTTLESVMGMASDKATQFAIALRIAGSSAEAYTGLALKMARQLKANEEEFARNSVATRDATGSLLPLDTVMQNAFTRMQQLKSGTDQAEFALQFFGRSVQEVYKMIVILPAAQERAKQLMADMNVELGPDKQAQIRRYQIEIGAFKEMLGLVGDNIAEKVLPQLENMAKYFNETGPAAANVFIKVLTGVLIATDFVANGFQELALKLKTSDAANLISEQTYWAAAKTLVTEGWDASVAVWDAGMKKRERIMLEGSIALLGMEADLQRRLALIGGDGSKAPPGPGPLKSGKGSFIPTPKTGAADSGVMAGLENELKAEEDAYNKRMLDQGSFQTWSITQTRDYWEEVLSMTTLSAKDRQAAQNQYYDAERRLQLANFAAEVATIKEREVADKGNKDAQIADAVALTALMKQRYTEQSADYKKALAEETAIRQEWAKKEEEAIKKIAEIERKSAEETSKYDIAMHKMADDQAVALRLMSNEQRLSDEKAFVQQEYAVDLAGINLRLAAEKDGTVEYAKILAEKLKLDQSFQKQLTALDNQAELERKQSATQAAQDFQNDFSSAIASVVDGTKSLKNAFLDFFKQLDSQLSKLASDQIAKQLFGAGTSGGNAINDIMGKIFGTGSAGSAVGSAGSAADTTATATHTTAVAADTATYTLGTPILQLAFTSLTAAATAAAAALTAVGASSATAGLGGGIATLFGPVAQAVPMLDLGTPYVPQDMLAIVHRGEAVIPAAQNNPGMLGGSRSLVVNNAFNFAGPVDTRTQSQIAVQTSKSVDRAMRRSR